MSESNHQKREYHFIPDKIRKELIELVEKQNYPIKQAGQLLKIKLSTAKFIIKKYRHNQKGFRKLRTQHRKEVYMEKEGENNTKNEEKLRIEQEQVITNHLSYYQKEVLEMNLNHNQMLNWYWMVQYYGATNGFVF